MAPNTPRQTHETQPNRRVDQTVVLGGDHLGAAIARQLAATGHAVTVVEDLDGPDDVPRVRGCPRDTRTLERAGLADADTVLVAMARDRHNLLVAQLVRTHFEVDDVFVLVRSPERCDLVEAAGHSPVCATGLLSDAVVDALGGADGDREQPA